VKGYVQVYTGNGKGKTTAALGLAMRAAGAGLRVFIGQFVKGCEYSELNALKRMHENITLKQYGRGCFIAGDPCREDVTAAQNACDELKHLVSAGTYDVVILDEANIATFYRLIAPEELVGIIQCKPDNVELIITGRYADPAVMEAADLVTEMKEVKHYYVKGVQARVGIEK
jgi:cob(I)alamin adenosyltransferase